MTALFHGGSNMTQGRKCSVGKIHIFRMQGLISWIVLCEDDPVSEEGLGGWGNHLSMMQIQRGLGQLRRGKAIWYVDEAHGRNQQRGQYRAS